MQKDSNARGLALHLTAITTAVAVFVLDQLIKKWLVATPFRWQSFWEQLSIGVSKNEGIAFSVPFPRPLLIVLSFIIIVALIAWWLKNPRKTLTQALAVGLFVGGALGNLMDRITRDGVVDYLNIFTGSFNLADAAIIAGLLVLVFQRAQKTGTISS